MYHKIDGSTIDDAEELDLVMLIFNLLEYRSNYYCKAGSLWFYSEGEAANFNDDISITNAFISLK